MKNKRLGSALLVGGSAGAILFAIASIFLYKNRLREVETEAFTVIGSGEVRTMQMGIENWFPWFLLGIILTLVFLVISCFGYRILKRLKNTNPSEAE